MEHTMYQKYQEALDALSFLRDILYNTKTKKEESRQEELITQAENLVQEAFELYQETHKETDT